MKKTILSIVIFFLSITVIFAQGMASPVLSMDSSAKDLAGKLNRRLIDEKAQNVFVGQFIYRDAVPLFAVYWVNQLTMELANSLNKSYAVVLSYGEAAEWTISGEIVDMADTIRVYTRLIRSSDRSIVAVYNSDFARDENLIQMLASTGGGRGSSSPVPRDAQEPDSWDNPVNIIVGSDENPTVVNRTLNNSDEDFFLIVPEHDGRLTVETTGSTDTYMHLYNADTRAELSTNDDGGSGSNARIRHFVRAGQRYIVKIRGYDSSETGSYGFQAYLQVQAVPTPDEYEPDNDYASAKTIQIGTPQTHNFHDSDDEDWVKFEITQAGRYTIRTRGVNSNRLDTYIELYDSNRNSIDEDDDGGERLDSRLTLRLDAGTYYLQVSCLDNEPDQPYTISITAEE